MTRSRRLDDGIWLALSVVALAGSFAALDLARSKGDTRRSVARAIRRESTRKDLVVVVDEAPELVAMVRPTPSLWGMPPLGDLTGVRRLYALAPTEAGLAPFFARLGPAAPFRGDVRVRRWDLADQHLGRVVFDALEAVGDKLQAHRDGGADAGPCPADAGHLACHGPPWNTVEVQSHHFEGAELRCVFAHPQADGTLVLEFNGLPPAHAIGGIIGIDDTGYHANAAAVNARVEYRATGAPPITREFVAPNKHGVTPWRIQVPHAPATATIRVTTANAGARQFCFTLVATE